MCNDLEQLQTVNDKNRFLKNKLTIYRFLKSEKSRSTIFAKKFFCFKLNFYSNIKEYLNL